MDWAAQRKLCRIVIVNKIDAENLDAGEVDPDVDPGGVQADGVGIERMPKCPPCNRRRPASTASSEAMSRRFVGSSRINTLDGLNNN